MTFMKQGWFASTPSGLKSELANACEPFIIARLRGILIDAYKGWMLPTLKIINHLIGWCPLKINCWNFHS